MMGPAGPAGHRAGVAARAAPWVLGLLVGVVLACFPWWGATALAQGEDTELCLSCHGQQGLTTFDGEKEIDLYVDREQYLASPHGQESCNSCHPQFQGFDHGRVALGEELRALTFQTCAGCHRGYDFG